MQASDYSYGIIPLQKGVRGWNVFVIKREKGFWEFPKGHAEVGEAPLVAAERELKEETGLRVREVLFDEPLPIHYTFIDGEGIEIFKEVLYYVAEVKGSVALQKGETVEGKWIPLEHAETAVTYDNSKKLCRELVELLQEKY